MTESKKPIYRDKKWKLDSSYRLCSRRGGVRGGVIG